ncbi:MAG: nuclear transport factor 2 family protein [Candidatus Binatia bacterium]
MGKWSKAELQAVADEFVQMSEDTWVAGDIDTWANWYTEDVVFRDLGFGYADGEIELRGRQAVRDWYAQRRITFPGSHAVHYPSPWQVIDEERGWIVMKWLTRMRDPGDGSIHEEACYSHLIYAGNTQFSYEEDIYSPVRMQAMMQRWEAVYKKFHGGRDL